MFINVCEKKWGRSYSEASYDTIMCGSVDEGFLGFATAGRRARQVVCLVFTLK